MLSEDALEEFYVHDIGVQRLLGNAGYQDVLDRTVITKGFYDAAPEQFRNRDVAVTGMCYFPRNTPPIPAESRIIAPPEFGGTTAIVVGSRLHQIGDVDVPTHLEVFVGHERVA